MSDEAAFVSYPVLVGELEADRDALRAENKQLRGEVSAAHDNYAVAIEEVERLKAENRGLSETIAEWQEIHGTFAPNPEIERLRAALAENDRTVAGLGEASKQQRIEIERLRAALELVANEGVEAIEVYRKIMRVLGGEDG